MAIPKVRAYPRVRRSMPGLRHSLAPLGNTTAAITGPISIEKMRAPSRANATVQAIGLNKRPSTRCKVKIGK